MGTHPQCLPMHIFFFLFIHFFLVASGNPTPPHMWRQRVTSECPLLAVCRPPSFRLSGPPPVVWRAFAFAMFDIARR